MTSPAPSWSDLYNDAKAELLLRRPDLSVLDGDISDMLLAAIGAVGDRLVGYDTDLNRATFVDGARGAELTKLADDHWSIVRVAAVRGVGSVTLSPNAVVSGTVPAGTVVQTEQDALGNVAQFTTDGALSWSSESTPKSVNVTCTLGGVIGNVAAGRISQISSTLFSGTFTVANAAATLGGAEEESDDALRERIRTFSTTLRRGTLAALEYGAQQVAQVKNAVAVEDQATGICAVYVSDVAGSSNAAMVSAVITELENWRAAGSLVNVVGGGLFQLNPISITLQVRAGVDTAAIADDVKAAIVARIEKLKIGETCQRAIIQQAALNVDLDNIIGCTVLLPAADVVPAAGQLIRTDVDFISVA